MLIMMYFKYSYMDGLINVYHVVVCTPYFANIIEECFGLVGSCILSRIESHMMNHDNKLFNSCDVR